MRTQNAVFVIGLVLLMTLPFSAALATAGAEPSDYLFGWETNNSVPANPYLYRFGVDGSIVWERSLPYTEFWLDDIQYDRNLKEDAFYLALNGESNRVEGKFRLQKYNSAGDLEWDLPLFEDDHPYPSVSANPVLGGVYVATVNQGVWRVDGGGNVLWGPTTFGFSTAGEIYWEACTDVTTGGGFAVRCEASGDGQVIRFDEIGSVSWTIDMRCPVGPQPNPLDGGVYVDSEGGRELYRLGPGGEIKWMKSCFPSCYLYSRAVSPSDGSLCIGSGWPSTITRIAMDGGVLWSIDVWDYASHYSLTFDLREDAVYVGWGETENRGFARHHGSDFSQVWHVPAPHGGFMCALDMGMPAASNLALTAMFDIKPGSCPNPLSTKPFEAAPKNLNAKKGGVLPVAILGTATFDVTQIDVSTVRLEGLEPLRYSYEDVATPPTNGEECECTTAGADGYVDLTLKFQKSEVVAGLGAVSKGDVVQLTVTGQLEDGTPFEGADCIRIVGEGQEDGEVPIQDVVLQAAVPNPFNPVTTIRYSIATSGHVSLRIFNAAGQLVRTLVDEEQVPQAGGFIATWDGKSDGGASVASGVYFYRLTAGDKTLTKKMVLLQ